MKLWLLLFLFLVAALMVPRVEGYKNVTLSAQTKLDRLTTRILPSTAICARDAQCISGKCLETNNESTYGFCQ